MKLNDPRLTVAFQELIDRRIDLSRRNVQPHHQYGVVEGTADTTKRTVSVRLFGMAEPTPGFVYSYGLVPRDGDHVRVYIDPRGDHWIDAIQGRDVVSEIVDASNPPPPDSPPDRALGAIARMGVSLASSASSKVWLVSDAGGTIGGTPAGWPDPGFNDSGWDTPRDVASISPINAVPPARLIYPAEAGDDVHIVGLVWLTRQSFTLASIPSTATLFVSHDDGASFYINGTLVHAATGPGTHPANTTPIDVTSAPFVVGENVLAASAYNDGGSGPSFIGNPTWVEWRLILDPPSPDLVAAPETVDGDDVTYHAGSLAEAIRLDLGAAYRIVRARVRIGCSAAGLKSYELRAANEPDFSDEVTVATQAFTSAGSYAAQDVTYLWTGTTSYRYFRLVGAAESRRIFTVELYEQAPNTPIVTDPGSGAGSTIDDALAALLAEIGSHLHDASWIDIADAGGFYAALNVEAALQELASKDIGYAAHGNTGAAETFDAAVGWHSATLDANCTVTLTGATVGTVAALVLELHQDGTGSRLVTWPGSVVWPGGSAPTLATAAGAVDTITLFSHDGGTTWFGFPTAGVSGSGSSMPWFNVEDYGAVHDAASTSDADIAAATDDSAAIEAACDACMAAGGGTVFFPNGIYAIKRALQSTSTYNSQIRIARNTITSNEPPIAIRFLGMGPVAQSNLSPTGGFLPSQSGAILRSDWNGTISGTPAVIAAGTSDAVYPAGSFNWVQVTFENIEVRCHADPKLTGIDLSACASGTFRNVTVSTHAVASTMAVPTHTNAVGIKMPVGLNSNPPDLFDSVMVDGFYDAYHLSEQSSGPLIVAAHCTRGLVLPAVGSTHHSASFGRVLLYSVPYGIVPTGGTVWLSIGKLNIEHDPAPFGTVADIYDPSNLLRGSIDFHAVAWAGTEDDIIMNGGAGVSLKSDHFLYEKVSDVLWLPRTHADPTANPNSGGFQYAALATGHPMWRDETGAVTDLLTTPGPPTGAAGGDLSGTYPNPSVVDDSHAHTAATLPAIPPGTRYEPLTSGASSAPELVFTADGRCVMVPVSD